MTLLLSIALLAQSWCQDVQLTGYVRTEGGTHTYDGTPIGTDEAIAAASWNIPMGWYVEIPDVGTFRVADRGGGLGSAGWIDIAVWTRSEAYALTRRTTACVYPPGEVPQ